MRRRNRLPILPDVLRLAFQGKFFKVQPDYDSIDAAAALVYYYACRRHAGIGNIGNQTSFWSVPATHIRRT